jgi:PAN domain
MSKKLFASSIATFAAMVTTAGVNIGSAVAAPRFLVKFNSDRIGQDYKSFQTNSMESCLRVCANEGQCKSFTYVPPGAQPGTFNAQGICWLKNGVPIPTNNSGGIISGSRYL